MIKKIFTVAAFLSATLIGQTLRAADHAAIAQTITNEYVASVGGGDAFNTQIAMPNKVLIRGALARIFSNTNFTLEESVRQDGFDAACIRTLQLAPTFNAWVGNDGHFARDGQTRDPALVKFLRLHNFMRSFFEKAHTARQAYLADHATMLTPTATGGLLVQTDPVSQLYNALITAHGGEQLTTLAGENISFGNFVLARVAILRATIMAGPRVATGPSLTRKVLSYIGYAAAASTTYCIGSGMVDAIRMDGGTTPLTTLAVVPTCAAMLAGLAWMSYQAPLKLEPYLA